MQNVMTELLKSFTDAHVNPDGSAMAMNNDYVVLFQLLPEDERHPIKTRMPGVFRANPVFKNTELERNPEGSLLVVSSYTEEECQLLLVGHFTEKGTFTPELRVEVRTPEEHVYITASEEFGNKLLKKMHELYTSNPDFVNESIAITDKNPGRCQLITFRKDYVSVQIPHHRKHDANWLGLIHLNLNNDTFYYDFYDEVDGERFTIAGAWDQLDLDMTEFFVNALIENPVLPRNKDGILY